MEPDSAMHSPISVEQIYAAREVVYRTLKPTPLIEHPLLGREIGARVFLKHENHQATGAFKVRGGVRFMNHFPRGRPPRGGVPATRGNPRQPAGRGAGSLFSPATSL